MIGPMHLGLTPYDFSDLSASSLAAQASFAETLGYESFWLPENHFNQNALPDPLMLLAAAAAATSTMQLATTSYLLPLRNPLLAAEQVAVLDQLCDGRVLLGVGRGYSKATLSAFDVPTSEKRSRFEWCLEIMRRAWCGDAVSLNPQGEDAVTVYPRPVQTPHPPIWVAAFGPKALAQAGRLGLPYLASPVETHAGLDKNFKAFDEAAAAAGHEPITVRPVMRTIFTSNNSSLVEQVRNAIAASPMPPGLSKQKDIDSWAIIGSPGMVKDALAELHESLRLSHLIVTRLRLDGVENTVLKDSLRLLAEQLGH